MLPSLPCERQKRLRKRMRRVGLETITSHKFLQPEQQRVSLVYPLPRAPRLHPLAQWLRHRRLATQAVGGAVALTPAEAHLSALHRPPPRLRHTLQLLPLAAVVEAARTDAFFISEISEKNGSSIGSRFSFLGRSPSHQELARS